MTLDFERDDLVLTFTVAIARNGDVLNDSQTHGNTFAEVYRAFLAIRDEVNRQIEERRNCPFNPKYGDDLKAILAAEALKNPAHGQNLSNGIIFARVGSTGP